MTNLTAPFAFWDAQWTVRGLVPDMHWRHYYSSDDTHTLHALFLVCSLPTHRTNLPHLPACWRFTHATCARHNCPPHTWPATLAAGPTVPPPALRCIQLATGRSLSSTSSHARRMRYGLTILPPVGRIRQGVPSLISPPDATLSLRWRFLHLPPYRLPHTTPLPADPQALAVWTLPNNHGFIAPGRTFLRLDWNATRILDGFPIRFFSVGLCADSTTAFPFNFPYHTVDRGDAGMTI